MSLYPLGSLVEEHPLGLLLVVFLLPHCLYFLSLPSFLAPLLVVLLERLQLVVNLRVLVLGLLQILHVVIHFLIVRVDVVMISQVSLLHLVSSLDLIISVSLLQISQLLGKFSNLLLKSGDFILVLVFHRLLLVLALLVQVFERPVDFVVLVRNFVLESLDFAVTHFLRLRALLLVFVV